MTGKLQRVLSAAARMVSDTLSAEVGSWSDDTAARWAPLAGRAGVTYNTCPMLWCVHRCMHGQSPRYLADHYHSSVWSRLSASSAFNKPWTPYIPGFQGSMNKPTPACRTSLSCRLNTYDRRAFLSDTGPTVWNSLPDELRDPTCAFDSFKQFLKIILFSLY